MPEGPSELTPLGATLALTKECFPLESLGNNSEAHSSASQRDQTGWGPSHL